MKHLAQALVALLLAWTGGEALAQSTQSETIARLRSSGVIHVGHRRDAIPFSYVAGPSGQPIGYSMSICERIVQAIRTQLKLPNLKTQYHPVVAETRVSMVVRGTIDMECGSTSNTAARRKEVDFSAPIFAPTTRVVVPKGSSIRRMNDLNGRRVAVTRGTNSAVLLLELMSGNNLKANFIESQDNESSYALLKSGKVDALALNDVLIQGMIAFGGDRGRFDMIDEMLPADPYGIMIRKNDPEFKALVDRAIRDMIENGVLPKLFLQWFRMPIPPKRINLELPLTEDMARIMKLVR
jgi:glutamate/aspartate transport system substrate-binding protein